jgi:hypothetical protein
MHATVLPIYLLATYRNCFGQEFIPARERDTRDREKWRETVSGDIKFRVEVSGKTGLGFERRIQ